MNFPKTIQPATFSFIIPCCVSVFYLCTKQYNIPLFAFWHSSMFAHTLTHMYISSLDAYPFIHKCINLHRRPCSIHRITVCWSSAVARRNFCCHPLLLLLPLLRFAMQLCRCWHIRHANNNASNSRQCAYGRSGVALVVLVVVVLVRETAKHGMAKRQTGSPTA